MADLKKKYKELIQSLEEHISDPDDFEYVQDKIEKLTLAFIDEIEQIEENANAKFKEIEKQQKSMEKTIEYLEKALNGIEKDIYADDDEENYDLEVVCPYCNYEFILDDDTDKNEVECPECGNIIEIDWDADCLDEGCNGGCHCSGCGSSHLKDNEDENPEKNENEDDM